MSNAMSTVERLPQTSVRAPEAPREGRVIGLASSTFEPNGAIPLKMVFDRCGGQNISPQLAWSGFPSATKSFALTCFDPDAPTGSGFWHWVVANIPASVTSFAENAAATGLPGGAVEGFTDYGVSHYGGPCPPAGDPPHRYVFTLYALDIPSIAGAGPTMTGARLVFSTRSHLLATGVVEGRYGTK